MTNKITAFERLSAEEQLEYNHHFWKEIIFSVIGLCFIICSTAVWVRFIAIFLVFVGIYHAIKISRIKNEFDYFFGKKQDRSKK